MLQVDKHLLGLGISSLPGVGWSTKQKLNALGIQTVADLRLGSLGALQQELGARTGILLWWISPSCLKPLTSCKFIYSDLQHSENDLIAIDAGCYGSLKHPFRCCQHALDWQRPLLGKKNSSCAIGHVILKVTNTCWTFLLYNY